MVYNKMSYYIEKRIRHITKFLEEWEDTVNNPPPERDALDPYWQLVGNLEELVLMQDFLNSLES